ncbi:MAG: hypothetical protein K0U98_03725 [Deltaproteobacteria bacterium]|nr:hypothetical protein [Deltaproteobacteria bacterium]
MRFRLSRRLSPAAKKALLRRDPEELLGALLDLTAAAEVEGFAEALEALGGSVSCSLPETHQLSVEIPAGRLADLADLRGVAHVELGTPYRPPAPSSPATVDSEE